MNSISLSICIPLTGSLEAFTRSADSICKQDFSNFEVVVSGPASRLNNEAFARLEQLFPTTFATSQESASELAIYNECLSLVQGEYVKFVLPGTLLDANCIGQFVRTLENHKNLALVSAPSRCISEGGDEIPRSIGAEFVGFRSSKSLTLKALEKYESPVGGLSNVMFRREFAMDGFKTRLDTLAEFEFLLQVMSFGDCVALSQTLLSVPFYETSERQNLRQESLIEFYDYLQLQTAHIGKLYAGGLSKGREYDDANRHIEEAFIRLCRVPRELTKESAVCAAKHLAATSSREELVELVAKYTELLYTRIERSIGLGNQLQSIPPTIVEKQPIYLIVEELNQYRCQLVDEFQSLVNSPSWKLTAPLRAMKGLLRSSNQTVKSFREAPSRGKSIVPVADFGGSPAGAGAGIGSGAKLGFAVSKNDASAAHRARLLNEIAHLEREIKAIRESASWRITEKQRQVFPCFWRDVRVKRPEKISEWEKADVETGLAADLVVFDDIFPTKLSAFRFAEYTEYLSAFPNCHVITTGKVEGLGKTRSVSQVIEEYREEFPELGDRVHRLAELQGLNAKLAYCVFLSLAFEYLPIFEEFQIPFVFTLYPGGMFEPNQPGSDAMLKRVLSSPLFRKVIVSQRFVKNYLLANAFCRADQIEEIIGCVTVDNAESAQSEKRYYGREKSTRDICFVAHRYHARGIDKGYDVFVDVAKELAKRLPDVYFHVVGGFTASDIDIFGIEDRVRFYGTLEVEDLQNFFRSMDAIVSPNRHGVHSPGQFDGFPTACCIEAGLNGVVPFCTDILNQNILLEQGRDIFVIDRNVSSITNILEQELSDMDNFYEKSRQVKHTFSRIFGYEGQIQPRINILTEQLSQVGVAPPTKTPLLASLVREKAGSV